MPAMLIHALFRLLTSPAWWLVRGLLLDAVLAHVAHAGFMSHPYEKVGNRIAGLTWQGSILAATDLLPSAETHYLRHVVARPEWPAGTTLGDYLQSIEAVIRDPTSGVVVSRYRGRWHLAVIRRSGLLQGPGGFAYVMVEYRIRTGHWMIAFQPALGLQHFSSPARTEQRWLRQPR